VKYTRRVTDLETALRVLALLRATPIADEATLVGSAALFGFETGVPPFTEDVDVCVPEELVIASGEAIVRLLTAQGFAHELGTATFTRSDGTTFDLLGHGDVAAGDHIGGHGALRVMVFEDLSRVVGALRATHALPGGCRALTPAGFVATKLLTERGHKGTKDKLQALLVLAERASDARFVGDVEAIFGGVEAVRREDARASAEEAVSALGDPDFRDAGAEGYASAWQDARAGLAVLLRLLDRVDSGAPAGDIP